MKMCYLRKKKKKEKEYSYETLFSASESDPKEFCDSEIIESRLSPPLSPDFEIA